MSTIKVNVVDSLGYSLKKGDSIAYPVRKGSKMWMEFGKIDSLAAEVVGQGSIQVVAQLKKSDGKQVAFQSFSRCIKL